MQECGPSAKICPCGDFLLDGLVGIMYESMSFGKSSNNGHCMVYRLTLGEGGSPYSWPLCKCMDFGAVEHQNLGDFRSKY